MIKKNKNLEIICTVLSLIIILLVGYIVLLKANYKTEQSKEEQTDIVQNLKEEKKYDLKKAELLLEEFGFNRRVGCQTVLQQTYNDAFKSIIVLEKMSKDKIYEEKCDNLFSQNALVEDPEPMYKGNIGVCKKGKTVELITYNDANAMYKKMYGEDMPITHISMLSDNSLDYALYEYLYDRDMFVKLDLYGVGGSCVSNHIREIKSAVQIENTIKITVYDFETGDLEIDNGVYHFESEKTKIDIPCNDVKECVSVIKNNYLRYVNEYEITFEVINNQYTLKSVESVL